MSTIKSTELDAGATALIEAYQQSSRRLDALPQPLAQLGWHALAESAAKAGRDTRRLQSEAIADRFERYRTTIDDTYGAASGAARSQVLKVAKHLAYGGSIGAIWAKLIACLAVMLGIAAWFASIGASLTKTGAGWHVLGILIGYIAGGNWALERANAVAAAGKMTDPLKELLAETLDKPEADYFSRLGPGSDPPARVSLSVAAPLAEAAVGLFWLICLVCALLVIYGAGQAIWGPVQEAQASSLHR